MTQKETTALPPLAGSRGSTGKRLAAISAGLRTSAAISPFTEKEVLGLSHVVPPGGVCFDIGAAYGMYTFALAHLVGSTGQVHSFEPLAGSARLLDAARRFSGSRNIRLHRKAAGREPASETHHRPDAVGLSDPWPCFSRTWYPRRGPERKSHLAPRRDGRGGDG
jgi:hypothetical protein